MKVQMNETVELLNMALKNSTTTKVKRRWTNLSKTLPGKIIQNMVNELIDSSKIKDAVFDPTMSIFYQASDGRDIYYLSYLYPEASNTGTMEEVMSFSNTSLSKDIHTFFLSKRLSINGKVSDIGIRFIRDDLHDFNIEEDENFQNLTKEQAIRTKEIFARDMGLNFASKLLFEQNQFGKDDIGYRGFRDDIFTVEERDISKEENYSILYDFAMFYIGTFSHRINEDILKILFIRLSQVPGTERAFFDIDNTMVGKLLSIANDKHFQIMKDGHFYTKSLYRFFLDELEYFNHIVPEQYEKAFVDRYTSLFINGNIYMTENHALRKLLVYGRDALGPTGTVNTMLAKMIVDERAKDPSSLLHKLSSSMDEIFKTNPGESDEDEDEENEEDFKDNIIDFMKAMFKQDQDEEEE